MTESRSLVASEAVEKAAGSPWASEVSQHAIPNLDAGKHQQEVVFIRAFSFIERPAVKAALSIVVFLNIIELAGETDFPTLDVWRKLDNAFVIFFLVELILRILYRGVGLFVGKDRWWALFDLFLLMLGMLDLWIIAPIFGWHSAAMETMRLLRLLRAFRIFKLLPKLTAFLSALVSMLGAFTVVFLVLFLTLLAASLLLKHLVCNDSILDSPGANKLSVQEKDSTKAEFHSVRTSLFTLFRVVTQDNWNAIAGPLNIADPAMRLFFIVFIAFASWTLISVLTGVASDEMIAATSNRKEEERLLQERRQKTFIEFLRKCFRDADVDGNGLLDRDEFEDLMHEPSMQETMSSLGLEMTLDELSKAWGMLDVDGHGELTIDDFVEGLSYLQETLSVKHIISIDYSVKRTSVRLEKCLDHLLEELVQVGRQSEMIQNFLLAQDERRDKLREQLSVWRCWAALATPMAVSSWRKEQGRTSLRRVNPFKPHPWGDDKDTYPQVRFTSQQPLGSDGDEEKEDTRS